MPAGKSREMRRSAPAGQWRGSAAGKWPLSAVSPGAAPPPAPPLRLPLHRCWLVRQAFHQKNWTRQTIKHHRHHQDGEESPSNPSMPQPAAPRRSSAGLHPRSTHGLMDSQVAARKVMRPRTPKGTVCGAASGRSGRTKRRSRRRAISGVLEPHPATERRLGRQPRQLRLPRISGLDLDHIFSVSLDSLLDRLVQSVYSASRTATVFRFPRTGFRARLHLGCLPTDLRISH